MITQALTPLETLIDAAVTYPAFADACRAAFSGRAGEDVLAALTAVAHPLFPPEGRTPEAVAREIGRREVVALLLRASGNISPTPSHARPTAFTVTRLPDQPEQPAEAPETTPAAPASAERTVNVRPYDERPARLGPWLDIPAERPAAPTSGIDYAAAWGHPGRFPTLADPADRPADADAIRTDKAPDDAGDD